MIKASTGDKKINHAEMAGARAEVYDLLVGIFGHLADQRFLAKIRGDAFNHILNTLAYQDSVGFISGIDYVRSYQSAIETRPDEEVLTELSVDRTRIMRGTGPPDLKPPYEGLYRDNRDVGKSLLEVKRFYRRAGMLPDETVREPPDYICLELDFMKQLCLSERDQWSSNADAGEIVAHEEAFLGNHLGTWVGEFCHQVEKHALTDFYRGLALILEAFISADTAYLMALTGSLKETDSFR